MSPEKMAMAVAVTMAAMAGTGAMKKVTGTSRATAMVALSPGMDTTNRPYEDEKNMTSRTCSSKTCPKAAKTRSIMSSFYPAIAGRKGVAEGKREGVSVKT